MSTVFVDRESAYPNRYRVIPDTGSAYYVVLERADEPVTPGTPLNAETFNGMRREIDAAMAPAGFGLGGLSAFLSQADDLNNVTKNGWYSWQDSPANAPGAWGNMIVTSQTGHCEQTVVLFLPYGCSIQRTGVGDDWSEWEWVNPPMITGLEYRTTERYQGAAVYKKVDTNGNILWRKDGESQWHLLSSANYVAAATVE